MDTSVIQAAFPNKETSLPPTERVYTNYGNVPLINLLAGTYGRVLDVGCGAGDNAALVKSRHPECEVYGITHSSSEASIAEKFMSKCWVMDIESDLPEELRAEKFDVMIFSHVLEHLRNPDVVVARFLQMLTSGGQTLIAVPNVLSFKMRLRFLRGNFQYEPAGVMDDTHLHFYTYFTADQYLLAKAPNLKVSDKAVDGNFPLWVLRRHLLPAETRKRIDSWGLHHWPNLFGHQVVIRAVKE